MSLLSKSRIYIGLLSLLAFSLSMPTAVFNLILPLAFLSALFNLKRGDIQTLLRNKLALGLWASYLLLLLGLLNTQQENLEAGWDLCLRRIFFVIAPLLFIKIERGHYRAIAYAFMAGIFTGFIICLVIVMLTPGVYGSLEQIYISNWYWSDILLEPIDKHRSYFTFYSVLAFFMAIQFFTMTKKKWEKALLIFFLLTFTGIILTLEARMFILIFPVLFLVFVVRKFKSIKYALLTVSLVILAGLLFFVLHPARFHNIRLLRLDNAANVRVEIYQNTLGLVERNWAFGVGTGDLKEELMKAYRENNFNEGTKIEYNAHNQYLEEWARGGLASILCLLLILLVSLSRAYMRSPEYLVLLIGLCLFLGVESALNRQQGISFVIFFLCFYYALPYKADPLINTVAKEKNKRDEII